MNVLFPIVALVHAYLADRVWKDVVRLREEGREPWLCGKLGWAIVTQIFGLLAVSVYWLTNHSALRVDGRAPTIVRRRRPREG